MKKFTDQINKGVAGLVSAHDKAVANLADIEGKTEQRKQEHLDEIARFRKSIDKQESAIATLQLRVKDQKQEIVDLKKRLKAETDRAVAAEKRADIAESEVAQLKE